ncbi:MAG: hypothetical protein K2J29_07370 [Muribaculaceae bacterium]|nr:hypothetical protein [Muribaculaceae bacterium]
MEEFDLDNPSLWIKRNLTEEYPGDWDTPTPIRILTDWLYGTKHEIICSFGHWHVEIDGSIIGACVSKKEEEPKWYPIWCSQLMDKNGNDNWILHLSQKGWFNAESYENFKRAYFISCKILNVEPKKQIHDYSELYK